jgi:hypothetical protein
MVGAPQVVVVQDGTRSLKTSFLEEHQEQLPRPLLHLFRELNCYFRLKRTIQNYVKGLTRVILSLFRYC